MRKLLQILPNQKTKVVFVPRNKNCIIRLNFKLKYLQWSTMRKFPKLLSNPVARVIFIPCRTLYNQVEFSRYPNLPKNAFATENKLYLYHVQLCIVWLNFQIKSL